MTSTTEKAPLGGVPAALRNLFQAQMKLSTDMFEAMTGMSMPDLSSQLSKRVRCGPRSCCDIPEPCWMPRRLCDCTSHVAQCHSACINVVIENCDRNRREVVVGAIGDDAKLVTVTPDKVALSPFERKTVKICLSVPDDAPTGHIYEVVILVRGCRDYVFRWSVSVGTLGMDSCHEVEIEDCPDYLHHWYDHFYCHRPCNEGRTGISAGVFTHG